MNKNKTSVTLSLIGGGVGAVLIGILFFTLSGAFASPTLEAPNGNPPWPPAEGVAGPAGPAGPQGPAGNTGPQGVAGPSLGAQCVMCANNCGGSYPQLGAAMAVNAFIGYAPGCTGAPTWNGNTAAGNEAGVRLCCR
jgi:hypothetical protein